MKRALLVLMLPLMSSCGSTTHVTDTLTCLGFCQKTRVEHESTPETKPAPKEKTQ
jgi:hypothetical protein